MDFYMKVIETLRLLAAPAETQLSKIPPQACRADEIAFCLEEIIPECKELFKKKIISSEVCQSIFAMDNFFLTFKKEDWTDQAVTMSDKWEKLRHMARDTLEKTGEACNDPNLFWVRDVF